MDRRQIKEEKDMILEKESVRGRSGSNKNLISVPEVLLRRKPPTHAPAVVSARLPERARSEEEVGVDVEVPLPSIWLL